MVASGLSNYCELEGVLPEEQYGSVRREQGVCCPSCADCKNSDGREKSSLVRFVDLQNAFDTVDRDLLP